MRTFISAPDAPSTIDPYSLAVKVGNTIHCSGQLGFIPATGELARGIEAQADQAFANIKAVLAAEGASITDVVKFTIFVADLNDFATVNAVMTKHVPAPYPARSCVEVAGPLKGGLVEIETIAVIN